MRGYTITYEDDTYFITHHNHHGEAITCKECGRMSYNPIDVLKLYCGHCHEFHETMQKRIDEQKRYDAMMDRRIKEARKRKSHNNGKEEANHD